jgi:hypothetical protein
VRKSHPKYRSKETMCKDVEITLNSDLSYAAKSSVIDIVLWNWSGFDGKYEGCPYWSEKAMKNPDAKLIHEHLVPRSVVFKKLLDLESPDYDQVYSLLETYCVGVVVTKEEDEHLNKIGLRQKMPSDWDGENPWARHEAGGITLFLENDK